VDPALRESAQRLTSSNLLTSVHPQKPNSRLQEFQILLDLARRERLQKNFSQASNHFVALLRDVAPAEMQRAALLELALMAEEQSQFGRAQQIFAQYARRFAEDPSVPEVLLRQGLIYRKMGAPTLALAKFYAVMTTALTLKEGNFDYYQRLVLQSQTEIADTFYLQGKHQEAAEFFSRLLKQNPPELDKRRIESKLIRCFSRLDRHNETIAQAQEFLARWPEAPEQAEIRFLLARSWKELGQNRDALQQVLLLLKAQRSTADQDPAQWGYWQRRTGNEIANQLYQEGDYLAALEIYVPLAELDPTPAWQVPVWYQVGLVYERLEQPAKAVEIYARISDRQKELATNASPGLKTVLEMAQWRKELLQWQSQAERSRLSYQASDASAPRPASP
jgi:tetratricopeptide (TPR) repeat protein